MLKIWTKLHKDESGAAMLEYGLMLALIAMVCLVAISLVGANLSNVFTSIGGSI